MSIYIDIPVDIFHGKIPDEDSFIFNDLKLWKTVFIDGNYPVKSATIMTSDYNSAFTFTHSEGIPKMMPLLSFTTSSEKINHTTPLLLSIFYMVGTKFKAFECAVLSSVSMGVHADFELLYCDDELLNEDGEMGTKNLNMVLRMLMVILYILSKMLTFGTQYEVSEQQSLNTNKKSSLNSSTLRNTVIRCGNRNIKVYGHKNKSYNRKSKGWNVRGHYRHYKSGKTIFISEYQKGDRTVEGNRTYKF